MKVEVKLAKIVDSGQIRRKNLRPGGTETTDLDNLGHFHMLVRVNWFFMLEIFNGAGIIYLI